MENHIYTFNREIRKQSKGGAIGNGASLSPSQNNSESKMLDFPPSSSSQVLFEDD